jgi:phage repressor protein C with HTH and peptisase S24 domain
MSSTRGERLRAARARRGFKSARLAAKALGIAISTYGAHERAEAEGGRDYGPDEAKFYARRFGVSPEWLLTGRGQGPRDEFPGIPALLEEEEAPKLPVIGYVGAGAEAHLYAVAQDNLDEVDQPYGSPDTEVVVEIRGDSLGPFFNRWLVFYDSVRRPATPDLFGELCVVGLSDGRILLKQLQRGSSEGLYNLSSPAEPPILDAKVEWAARVTSMSRR